MEIIWIVLTVDAAIALLILAAAYLCFRLAFYSPEKGKHPKEEYSIPRGRIYEPHREQMVAWMKEARAMPHQDMAVTSFDGLTLRGKYYEYAPGAPIELMFHGYRGNSERDLCGGVQRCFALGRSALIVDQRGCGRSEGNIITFGVLESRDCHTWIDFMLRRFGKDVKIILTGISMGASTVMIAAGRPLPENVIGVLADCGFTSAKDIICKVIRDLRLPAKLLYPIIKLGARIFAGVDLEACPPVEAVKHCTVPLILFHGENDDFVPCEMSRKNYESCAAPRKKLLTIPGAGHGLGYMLQPQQYLQTLREFFIPELGEEQA